MSDVEQVIKSLEYMLLYQKNNNIEKKCWANVQLFRDVLMSNGDKPKIKPAIVFGNKNDETLLCKAHVVILNNDGTLFEPSYEITLYKDATYYHSISEFMKFKKTCEQQGHKLPTFNKDDYNKFLNFVKNAELLNNDSLHFDYSDEYYQKLGKHVFDKMVHWREKRKPAINKSIVNPSVCFNYSTNNGIAGRIVK